MFSSSPANVQVEHHPRLTGESTYNFFKIVALVMRILFNYSSFPLRVVSVIGVAVAGTSFLLGLYYLARALFVGISVQGWATVVILLSFFNGIAILMLSMLGEYTVRLLNQTSQTRSYHIKEVVCING